LIVVDASVVAPALGDDGADGDRARSRLRGERLVAPHLIDLEVSSVWRRQLAAGLIDLRRVALAVEDLLSMPLRRAPHDALLHRCWQLRDTMTMYDAAYVALAEALGAPLLTADRRLSCATGARCDIEIVQ
jgi:predicted nucleic acid-binding protein